MEEQNYLSKDAIRQQMFEHISTWWGIRSVEELDPIVLMLIEGLASELYTIRQELKDSHLRIIEKISGLLSPSVLTFPKPAHAIARADIIEPICHIDKYTRFQIKNLPQEIQSYGVDKLDFVPVADVRLVSAQINYLVCERRLYKTNDSGGKELLAQAEILDERINHTAWIGLQIDPEIDTLSGISFYLDFPHTDKKFEKYSLLPYTEWSYAGNPIEMESGLPVRNKENQAYSIFDKYALLEQADKYIMELYRLQFLTVTSDLKVCALVYEPLPAEIRDIFPEKAVSTLVPSIWIKVVVPPHIFADNLYDLTVNVNCFPVANKILFNTINHTQEYTGIFPLKTSNHTYFLSVEKVSDSYNHAYKLIPYTTEYGKETGVFTLKQSGMERFDERSAKIYLERILDLLRSEKMAFTSIEMDSLRNVVNRLDDNLKDMEAKYKAVRVKGLEDPYYLLLNAFHTNETIYIDYWGTNAELANGIKSGKTLTPTQTLSIRNGSCKLLKMSSGGKSAPTSIQKLDVYRYTISSHDLIVTNENIVNFLKMELNEKITQIDIKKGVAVSSKPHEGFVRTTDIYLTATPGYEDIIRQMETELLTQLKNKSPDIYNFRIFLNG